MENKNRIKELEEEIENKEIMIKALLNEIKRLKNKRVESFEDVKRTKIEVCEGESKNTKVQETKNTKIEETKNTKIEETKNTKVEDTKYTKVEETKAENNFKEEVNKLINHKQSNKSFGGFLFLDDFIEFCGDSISFSFNANSYEPKGALKTFVVQNYPKIALKISKEVNKHPLLRVVSTLNCISSHIPPIECCVIFHDILLMIENYSKLHFIFHSLFKHSVDEGLLGTTILSIMGHQQKVDCDYLKGKKNLIHQINSLKYPFEIPKPSKTLENILLELTIPIGVFKENIIDENIYQRIFSIRILTHYLDWDYTYNTYCNEILYPRINESESFILYLGIVAFNSLRLFGNCESVESVFEVIKSKLDGVSPSSVLSYLLLKQIDPKQSSLWLSLNKQSLIEKGWSIEYLQTYLLF